MDVAVAFAAIPGLRSRSAQLVMAGAVDAAASDGVPLLVHAPTGIGKSLGYLVPLAAAGRRFTVATATKALQAQLVERDLPRVAEAFGVTYALALGRANFFCKSRGDALYAATRLAASPAEEAAVGLVEWASTSDTGLRTDAPPGTRDDAWDLVSTSGEECPGQRGCSWHADCFAEKARARALEADIVVTNHHLLLLELALRRVADAPGVMLPETGVIVVDEAHRLADTAAELFGATIRGTRAGRAGSAIDALVRAGGRPSDWGRRLRTSWEERTRELRPGPVLPGTRAAARLGDALGQVAGEVAVAGNALANLVATDEDMEGGLHAARQRLAGLASDLVRIAKAIEPAQPAGDPTQPDPDQPGPTQADRATTDLAVWVEQSRTGERMVRSALVEPGAALRRLLWERPPPRRRVRDRDSGLDDEFEVGMGGIGTDRVSADGMSTDGMSANGTRPGGYRAGDDGWESAESDGAGHDGRAGSGAGRGVTIACSATLAVGGRLDGAAAALGAGDPTALVQASPFDFERNALLYVPGDVPAPGGTGFAAAAEAQTRRLVSASRGRALVLCTSWRALESMAAAMADLEYGLLVQGSDSAPRLAERFRDEVSSVLIATRTFFEGIDVPGESLSMLILDRLPFPPPDDPLLAERGRRAQRRGGSRFAQVWLPAAAVSLQQALGRLIRTEHDRGVMAVLDRRLADAPYAAVLRDSLPPAPLTRSLDDVRRFFATEPAVR
jgi:ATP-dependent DNA helicase DinG